MKNILALALTCCLLLGPTACMQERQPDRKSDPEAKSASADHTVAKAESTSEEAFKPTPVQEKAFTEIQMQKALHNYNKFQALHFGRTADCSGDPIDLLFQIGKDIEKASLDQFPISEADEEAYGREFYKSIKEEYRIIPEDRRLDRIRRIANRLLPYRERKSIQYDFYLIEHEMVNAFTTIGGHIYVTTGLLEFLGSDDEQLASVLGHEIVHSDKKHCTRNVQKLVIANEFLGEEVGTLAANVNLMLSAPFGQADEYEADRGGAYIANKAGFDPYGAVRFFNKLSEMEGQYNPIDKMLRTHPYSEQRVTCLKKYINEELNGRD